MTSDQIAYAAEKARWKSREYFIGKPFPNFETWKRECDNWLRRLGDGDHSKDDRIL